MRADDRRSWMAGAVTRRRSTLFERMQALASSAGSGSRPDATPLPVSSEPATVIAGALSHKPETRGE